MKLEIFLASLAINFFALALPLAMLQVFDRILGNAGWRDALLLFGWVAAALLLEGFFRFARSLLIANRSVERELNGEIFGMQKLLRTDFGTLEAKGLRRLHALFGAPSRLRDLHLDPGCAAFHDLPFTGLFLALLFLLGGNLVLIPLAAFGLVAILAALTRAEFVDRTERFEKLDAARSGLLERSFDAMETLRSMAMESLLAGSVRGAMRARLDARDAIERKTLLLSESSAFLGQVTMVLILGLGGPKVLRGELTLGSLTACVILGGRATGMLTDAMARWAQRYSAKLALGEQAELSELPEVKILADGVVDSEPLTDRSIEFSDLVVRWSDRTTAPLSLRIEPGEIAELRGPRIAVSLAFLAAAGFTAPTGGSLRIGGKELAVYDPETFRHSVILIPKKPELFNGTLMENLTMFDSTRESRAREWANRIGLTDLCEQLPQGFLTNYRSEIVSPIPDGIVRRIALARALSLEPKILMVDHGFHGLDDPGAQRIAETLASLRGKVTILLASRQTIFRDLATRSFEVGMQVASASKREAE